MTELEAINIIRYSIDKAYKDKSEYLVVKACIDKVEQDLQDKSKAFDELKDFIKEQKEKAAKCLEGGYYMTQIGRDNLIGKIDAYNEILKKAGVEQWKD